MQHATACMQACIFPPPSRSLGRFMSPTMPSPPSPQTLAPMYRLLMARSGMSQAAVLSSLFFLCPSLGPVASAAPQAGAVLRGAHLAPPLWPPFFPPLPSSDVSTVPTSSECRAIVVACAHTNSPPDRAGRPSRLVLPPPLSVSCALLPP
jgi:hypothetical protein